MTQITGTRLLSEKHNEKCIKTNLNTKQDPRPKLPPPMLGCQ